jgi:hypothetical protein
MSIKEALDLFILDPSVAQSNFRLAQYYEQEGQTAAAISFYLRCAEFTSDRLESYESLLRMYLCFNKQTFRTWMCETLLFRAISLIPDRPEAYYLLCQFYENIKRWNQSYYHSRIGETMIFNDTVKLKTDIGYPGKLVFTFYRSVASWWLGLYNESLALSYELQSSKLPDSFMTSINNNVKTITEVLSLSGKYGTRIDFPYYLMKENMKYNFSMHHRLKLKFPDSSKVVENFSQCFQDMFVLGVNKGKRNGKFLEIGCGLPIANNNTYLLEKYFDWEGISVDINKTVTDLFSKQRKSKVFNVDATTIDYNSLLDKGDYDYLQIDCDPATISYKILLNIPFDTHKFAVITFEHDYHIDENKDIRQMSRDYLTSLGYVMIANDISFNKYTPFEDWWVHPDLVDETIINKMKCISDETNKADMYMLNKL